MDHTLRASVIAAGLATLANISKSPELMSEARIIYMVALRNINAALRSPADAIKDSTLIYIMVVSAFEAITGSTRMSLKAWTEHINGASDFERLEDVRAVYKYRTIDSVIFCSASVTLQSSLEAATIRKTTSQVLLENS